MTLTTLTRLPPPEVRGGPVRVRPALAARSLGEALVVAADLTAKAVLLGMLVVVVLDPSYGNLEGKAPVARAITYPVLAFLLPAWWLLRRQAHGRFPWSADLLLTLVCFSDILGNRLDLYDRVTWFDDWMHFMNTALVGAAAVLLTLGRDSRPGAVLSRSVAVGITAAIAWEVFEYVSFMTVSSELPDAYADTLGDLVLGWSGAVVGAVAVSAQWHRAHSRTRTKTPVHTAPKRI